MCEELGKRKWKVTSKSDDANGDDVAMMQGIVEQAVHCEVSCDWRFQPLQMPF